MLAVILLAIAVAMLYWQSRNPEPQPGGRIAQMNVDELEKAIEEYIIESSKLAGLRSMLIEDPIHVIKYMPAKFLAPVLSRGELYASERAGFTWGDALYVTPVWCPLTTMMYGDVGVVGTYTSVDRRFFDATLLSGIELYQGWIQHQKRPYRELTTTVHASSANRELRNAFRTRFQIDCVLFRPDEACAAYVDTTTDLWLAITHWDVHRTVGHGFAAAVNGLKWCVIAPDAFESDGLGYKASLHTALSASHKYVGGHYTTLAADVIQAYTASAPTVVVCDFT